MTNQTQSRHSALKKLINAGFAEKQVSTEVIAQQNDDTFEKLTEIITRIKALDLPKIFKDKTEGNISEYKELTDLIFKRFGLKTKLMTYYLEAACVPLSLNIGTTMTSFLHNNDLLARHLSDSATILENLKKPSLIKGSIDLKKAKVSGWYSEVELDLFMNFAVLFVLMKLEPDEVAAILLHEIGHLFYSFEFMFRTHAASQVLAAIHQQKTNRTSEVTYDQIIDVSADRLLKEGLITNREEFVKLTEVSDKKIIQHVVLSLVWAKMSTDFGSGRQTASNFENLADEFAGKFGASHPLLKGMMKYDGGADIHLNERGNELMHYITTALGILSGIGILFLIIQIFSAGETAVHDKIKFRPKRGYDKPMQRYLRMKRNIVSELKSPVISPERRKILLAQIDDIDQTLAKGKEFDTVADKLANYFFKSRRDAAAAFKLEHDLETLANNELFVAANRLRDSA